MGMFDYVNYECDCPKCGYKVKGFQTKCGDCMLETLEPKDVRYFYSSCGSCNFWIEFDLEPPTKPVFVMNETGIRIDGLTLEVLTSED